MRCRSPTSASRGTLSRVSVWSVSMAAIISGRVAFFAPEIGIEPLSAFPPAMRMRSMPPAPHAGTVPSGNPDCGRKPAASHLTTPGLAVSLVFAKSGGIVGLGGGPGRGIFRAAFPVPSRLRPTLRSRLRSLRPAALEIVPQRRRQALRAARFLWVLWGLGHGGCGPSVVPAKGCATDALVARIAPFRRVSRPGTSAIIRVDAAVAQW